MTETTISHHQPGSLWSLWVGVLGGPVVYSVHFWLVYTLAEAACQANLLRYRVLGLEAIAFWVVVATVAAAALTGYGAWLAYGNWQQLRGQEAQAATSYAPFMAFIGLWLSVVFTIVILLTGLPALFLVLCDWI